jgi:hypothetical protein
MVVQAGVEEVKFMAASLQHPSAAAHEVAELHWDVWGRLTS